MDNTADSSRTERTEQAFGSDTKLHDLQERMRDAKRSWKEVNREANGGRGSGLFKESIFRRKATRNTISEKMSEAYWSLENQSRPSALPDPNNEYLSVFNTYHTKAMDTLLEKDAPSELAPNVWQKLLDDTEAVRLETFASACMSRNEPIQDTAHTRAVSRMFWGVIDNVSSTHKW
jgi:hypothetical protein